MKRRPRLNLEFQCATRATGVPPEADFRRWAEAALQGDCSVTVRVVGRPEGRALNLGYRGRDYATNVLTFVYEAAPACLGDLALCAPVVKVEARRQGKPVQAHWAHLTVHGMKPSKHKSCANSGILTRISWRPEAAWDDRPVAPPPRWKVTPKSLPSWNGSARC